MRRPKIDLSGVTTLALEAAPKVKNMQTGEIAVDEQGRTRYAVAVFMSDPATNDSGMVKVTVPSASPIEVTPGTPVRLVNPRVMHWDNNGRSGMAWSADGVEAVKTSGRGDG